ncbi:MAG: hypothetical protein CL700_02160 [Chloroflexi bacterium]|nr:hypothetical protein [Chloroflexota bacterium]
MVLPQLDHVARLRKVSKAARKLRLGRSTESIHIRQLEVESALQLFNLEKRTFQLSSEGTMPGTGHTIGPGSLEYRQR